MPGKKSVLNYENDWIKLHGNGMHNTHLHVLALIIHKFFEPDEYKLNGIVAYTDHDMCAYGLVKIIDNKIMVPEHNLDRKSFLGL
jgi:hypothetical protein